MLTRSNLHTHTTYCDGKNTPREMVEAAIAAGFRSIGFSGHAFEGDDAPWTMDADRTARYFAEVAALKREYAGRIAVYVGLEVDAAHPSSTRGCDYVIGSNHYFQADGAYYSVDGSREALAQAVQAHLHGDMMEMLRSYFSILTEFALHNSFDILGHFDIPTKFNADGCLFDAESPAYRELALSALDAIAQTGVIFEVNTGAISRGYTRVPYPARFLLERLREKHVPVLLSADAHSAETLCGHFEEAEQLLLSVGYREVMELTGEGFRPVPLL